MEIEAMEAVFMDDFECRLFFYSMNVSNFKWSWYI